MSDSRTGWSWDGGDGSEPARPPAHGSDGSGADAPAGSSAAGGANPWERPADAPGSAHGADGSAPAWGAPGDAPQGQWGSPSDAPQGQWGSPAAQDQWGAPAAPGAGQGYGQYGHYGPGAMPGGPLGYGAAPRPGIIPLRPLSVGEIYEGAIQAIRTNPAVMFGATLVIYAILAVVSALLTWMLAASFFPSGDLGSTTSSSFEDVNTAMFASGFTGLNLVVPVLTFLATTLLTGVLICSVSQAVIGRKVSFAQVWELVKPRFWRLVAQSLLMSALSVIYLIALLFVIFLPGAGIIAASDPSGDGTGAGAGLAVMVLLFLAALPLTLYLYGRLAFAPAAVALETDRITGRPMGPVASFGRSWRLTKGSGWRVAGILLLTTIIVAAVSFALALPATFISGLLIAASSTASLIANSFLSTLINAVAVPFFSGTVALLYIDLRMRKESLDVELARAAGAA